jgi:hypothetical protein
MITTMKKAGRRLLLGSLIGSFALAGSVVGVAQAATPKDGPPAAPAPTPGIPMPNPNPYEIPMPVPLPGGGA